jgi:hypothetical protein
VTRAGALRFVVEAIAEGLIFSGVFCVVGALTLQLVG